MFKRRIPYSTPFQPAWYSPAKSGKTTRQSRIRTAKISGLILDGLEQVANHIEMNIEDDKDADDRDIDDTAKD